MEKHVYTVDGMTCGGCSGSLERLLKQEPGVGAASASHVSGTCEVELDPAKVSDKRIAEIVAKAGFTLTGEIA